MSGRVRTTLVVLPTIITIGLVAAAGAAILVQRQDRSDELQHAEEVGSAYFSDVATFEARLRRAIAESKSREPAALKKIVDAALRDPPQLGPAPDAASRSRTYQAAVRKSATVLDPYQRLSRALGRSIRAEPFVDAADDLLAKSPGVLAGFIVFESASLRSDVIPELTQALQDFQEVPVPDGAEDVAATVEGAVRFAIGQVDVMARRADAGESYQFEYGEQYDAAHKAVKDFAIEVDADLAEALDRVRGARST